MATIHQFTQYLFALNHQGNAARLSWFNFCKNHCEGTSSLDPQTINRFICRALSHSYWQNHRLLLSQEIFNTLENFFLRRTSEKFDFSKMYDPIKLQIVAIEDINDLERIVENHIGRNIFGIKKFSVRSNDKKQAVAIKSMNDNTLQIQCFDNLTYLKDGELVPLTNDCYLFYNERLELDTRFIQHITVAPNTTARFVVSGSESRISGSMIRDYSFQKYDNFSGQLLRSYSRIYYPIKKLEQLFIDPKSEPQYQELLSNLERVTSQVKANHPDSFNIGKAAIEKTKMSMDSLYPGDKVLSSLVRELQSFLSNMYGPKLEHIVNNTRVKWESSKPQEKSDSTNISLTAE